MPFLSFEHFASCLNTQKLASIRKKPGRTKQNGARDSVTRMAQRAASRMTGAAVPSADSVSETFLVGFW